MDTLRRDFFDATAWRQGFRSDNGQLGSYRFVRRISTENTSSVLDLLTRCRLG